MEQMHVATKFEPNNFHLILSKANCGRNLKLIIIIAIIQALPDKNCVLMCAKPL